VKFKTRVTLTVEFDLDAYQLEYGDEGGSEEGPRQAAQYVELAAVESLGETLRAIEEWGRVDGETLREGARFHEDQAKRKSV
jgi:hypothetical protein